MGHQKEYLREDKTPTLSETPFIDTDSVVRAWSLDNLKLVIANAVSLFRRAHQLFNGAIPSTSPSSITLTDSMASLVAADYTPKHTNNSNTLLIIANVQVSTIAGNGTAHFSFYRDGNEISGFRRTLTLGANGEANVTFFAVATGVTATTLFALHGRRYSASHSCKVNATLLWDGASSSQVVAPTLAILELPATLEL